MIDDSLKEFEKMFDLIPSKNEDTQVEEYGNSVESEEPFEELIEEVNSDIKNITENGKALEVENPHDIVKDIMAKGVDYQEEVKQIKKEREIEPVMFDDDFDTLPEMGPKESASEEIKEVINDISEFHNEIKQQEIEVTSDSSDVIEESSLDQINIESSSMIEGDKIKWSLVSPSVMYESFYRQKKNVLDSCLAGGQIEFLLWARELEDASVDVITEVFDQQVIIKQMEDVQQFRNRVKYIGVRVNNQYFLFDRFTPLLRGYLARIQYIKPALKQDGLVLEHMGDIEFYFERLRSLHKSVADAEKNLAAAYEMLSRKVTICMELPPVERYSKPEHRDHIMKFQYEQQPSEELSDFDDLPTDAIAGPEEKKSGPVGWDGL